MLADAFKTAAFQVYRWAGNRLFHAYTEQMFRLDQEGRDRIIGRALLAVDRIAPHRPDLAVTWSSTLLYFARPGSVLQEIALRHVVDNMDGAYRSDPAVASESAFIAAEAVGAPLSNLVNRSFDKAAPDRRRGPWGFGPEAWAQIHRDHDKSRALVDKWRDRLFDLKTRLFYPPGPNDVTFPAGESWPGKPRDEDTGPPGP